MFTRIEQQVLVHIDDGELIDWVQALEAQEIKRLL